LKAVLAGEGGDEDDKRLKWGHVASAGANRVRVAAQ